MAELVRVFKDGAVLKVHPTCVRAHERVGWVLAPDEVAFNGADPAKFDHDEDGSAGGSNPSPAPAPGDPPANWRELHWTQRVKLAKARGAADDLDAKAADAFLEALSAQ